MRERSPKVRPDPSPCVSNEPPRGGLIIGRAGGPRGYLCPRRCPGGAVSNGGVAILPARAQGPEQGPPGPAFPPGPLSGCKMRGLQSAARRSVWSAPGRRRELLRPLPFKSPPGTGNRGNAGEMRTRPTAPASSPPAPAGPGDRRPVLYRAGGAALGSPRPLTPKRAAPHRWEGAAGRHCACATRGARSAPHADSGEGLSPPPLLPSSFPSTLTWGRAW